MVVVKVELVEQVDQVVVDLMVKMVVLELLDKETQVVTPLVIEVVEVVAVKVVLETLVLLP